MAAELVSGAIISSLCQRILDTVISGEVVDFFRVKKLNDKLLRNLNMTLLSVNVLLDDAEKKQIISPDVKRWLENLKEVIFEAEELLNEIQAEVLICQLESEYGSRISRWKKAYSFSRFGKVVEQKIQEVIDRLKCILKESNSLGLQVGFQNTTLQRLPAPLVEESIICGRDSDKEKIIRLLLSDSVNESKISVIPIVGMAGIGKTTLAQLVYGDNRVNERFDIKLWITVSDDFDIFKITKKMLNQVTSCNCDVEELYQLQVKLKLSLRGKKFLFVYDDVWNENYGLWDALRSPFESGARGSKIILTTRSEIVASMMGNGLTYKLQEISDEDCWNIFAKHAFNDVNLDLISDLQGIGREIVKKCRGIPLSVKSVAGLLRSVRNPEEWGKILKSDIWELQLRENSSSNVLPALWLSYQYLPPNLKQCFAYCSIFPKDYTIEKENVILLWMAEGILRPEEGKRIEDVGEEYFRDLISRSLFQRLSQDESTVTMHDLVHDLAIFVSGEFCITLERDNLHEIPQKVRHLSYIRMQYDGAPKFDVFYEAKNLHTFLPLKFSSSRHFLAERVLSDLLPKLRSLRVLCLSHYSNVTKLPDSIGKLKQLRYLDLSHTAINMLRSSICTLYNLQTLRLLNCVSLTQLPCNIGRLVNLRHLYICGTNLKEMPQQMGGLKNLQTIDMFVVGKGSGSSINELKHFQNLRGELSVLGLQNVDNLDGLEANFKDKKHIVELVLRWDTDSNVYSQNAEKVLGKLLPHINLKKLTIVNYGGVVFPNWLGDPSFSNVGFISLTNCKNCTSLPPLGQLPSLKELSISGFNLVKIVGYEFYGRGKVEPFYSLEILKFENMVEWKDWLFADGENEAVSVTFPCLRELYMVNCPKLTGYLPPNLPALTELVLVDCPQLRASVPVAPDLCQLDLIHCEEMVLKFIPSQLYWLTIIGCCTTESLFEELDCSKTSLKELHISKCCSLRCLFKGSLPQTLKAVGITDCRKLELSMHCSYAFLESLSICRSCDSLRSFSLHSFPTLNRLHIEDCYLKSLALPEEHHQVNTSLNFLQISRCPKFLSFPEGGLSACKLKWLWIEKCENLESLPEQMHSLMPNLEVLYISHCPKLAFFPEGGLPSKLNSLSISFCEKLISHREKWHLERLPSLEYFNISSDCEDLESFPGEVLLPSTLFSLHISGICNLKSLEYKGLQHLSSLKELKIRDCPKLQSIPNNCLPSSLSSIHISNCPLLKKKGLGKYGQNWARSAPSACIQVDDKVIFCDQA